MIGIPTEFAPSALLYYDQGPAPVQTLLEKTRAFQRRREWSQAERCAVDARGLCRENFDHPGTAAAQLHLAEIYGEVGELGQAIEQSLAAYELLSRQPAQVQRHNEAIAAYTLGILCERRLFDSERRALYWYQKALQQFQEAQEYWASRNERSQFELCQRIREWIENRCRQIVERRSSHPLWQAAFDIWRLESAETPFTRNGALRGYIISDRRIWVAGTPFKLRSGKLPRPDDGERYYHFGVSVLKDQWAILESQAGDLALIRQQWRVDQERMGIVWQPGDGWVAVGFKRGRDGKIRFYPRHPETIGELKSTPGDPEGKLKGYIVALLKPEE